MAQRELLKLVGVDVEGLFGIYDHQLDLNVDDRVTILHGPNGVGKTTVLKMIDALMGNRLEYFGAVPFSRFRLRFADGRSLELGPDRERNSLEICLAGHGSRTTDTVDLSGRGGSGSIAKGMPDSDRNADGAGSLFNLARYFRDGTATATLEGPPWLGEFIAQGSVHLIDTHRLERRGRRDDQTAPPSLIGLASETNSEPSVLECGRGLQARLDAAMADYGRVSQALDQAFPRQLISAASEPALAREELGGRLAEVRRLTDELFSLGILNEPVGHEIVDEVQHTDETVSQVMTLYVKNAEEKLAVLNDLAGRVRSLIDGVNTKFKHKQLRLDRKKGLVAEGDAGPLALDSLSSGEQHEIVLHYNLLFMVQPNTVVLIDEPEISLHVAWQEKFLRDLLAMAELSRFDALVATHSPYIAGERTDLMVALGDAD